MSQIVNFQGQGPDGSMSQVFGLPIPSNSYKPITNTAWVRAWLCKLPTRVYQLLAHGRWFSPASSTTKTGHHDIAEILLKVALNTKNQINQFLMDYWFQRRFFLINRRQQTPSDGISSMDFWSWRATNIKMSPGILQHSLTRKLTKDPYGIFKSTLSKF